MLRRSGRRSAAGAAGPTRSAREVLAKLRLSGTARTVLIRFEHLLIRCSGLPLVGRRAGALLGQLQHRVRQVFDLDELVRVCSSLDEERLRYWVAGGWGLDLLAGCETRRHADLDLCLDDFEHDLPRVDRLVSRLGYHADPSFQGGVWFPDVAVFEDHEGHRIEVVSVNWRVLDAAEQLFAPSGRTAVAARARGGGHAGSGVERCTTSGTIGGATLPTFSLAAHRLFHLGYEHLEHRPEDVLAGDLLAALSADRSTPIVAGPPSAGEEAADCSSVPSTLLLVPIFSFPSGLWRLCKQFGNDLDAIPPHVTLAYPFLPLDRVDTEVIGTLCDVFDEWAPFELHLGTIGWFGTDVTYVEPSSSQTFEELIATLQRTFPDFRPYDGAFDSVVPHVTLSQQGSVADRRALAKLARAYLPFTARATHVWLMSNKRHPDEWSIERIFPLGSGHPS